MMYLLNFRAARAALGAVLLTLVAGCSDAPSGLRRPALPEQSSRIADDRDAVEGVTITSHVSGAVGNSSDIRDQQWTTSARGGIARIDMARLGMASAEASAPATIRVWERAAPNVRGIRRPRLSLRLADGRVAVIERAFTAEGVPTSMSVRVGQEEFRWEQAWVRNGDRLVLSGTVIESRHRGAVVSRTLLNVKTRRYASASIGAPPGLLVREWLTLTKRFGSIAGTVLLPRVLGAQTDSGKACSGAAARLNSAWMGWRVATVVWFATIAFGSGTAILKATTAEFAASAAVEVAEANYIDCYVAATYAGVPDGSIAPPPEQDEP